MGSGASGPSGSRAEPWPSFFLAEVSGVSKRCPWCEGDALMEAYHDQEWGVPERDARALWEKLILDGFQAGLSWKTILYKRAAFREAFDGFDPERVARYRATDVDRLLANPGIIRSRAKIRRRDWQRPGVPGDREQGRWIFRFPVGPGRRKTARQSVSRGDASPGANGNLGGNGKSAEAARLQVLRPGDRLCVHAGHWDGERPFGRMSSA